MLIKFVVQVFNQLTVLYEEMRGGYATADATVSIQSIPNDFSCSCYVGLYPICSYSLLFFAEVASQLGYDDLDAVTKEDSEKTGKLIFLLPGGVQAMSGDVEGLVETSLNMGQLSMKKEQINLGFSVRSSIESAKYMLMEKLYALTESFGGSCKSTGDYPGWAYRVDSPLRDSMVKIYTEMFGKAPKIEAIHAGLECGFFLGKIPELDCVSIGPEMKDIHTTEETMSISSVKRTWEFILKVLEEA